jgi:hypothetical protein
MNLFITLLENVNKSRTSANNVSLKIVLQLPFELNILDEALGQVIKKKKAEI